jgi:hypothetical protein
MSAGEPAGLAGGGEPLGLTLRVFINARLDGKRLDSPAKSL